MDILEAIMTRRSIRRTKNESIDEESIQILLEAGANAPSAGNQQPWDFIVVDDRGQLFNLADTSPYSKTLLQSSLAIVVCINGAKAKYPEYAVQDCSAATQNILLAAVGIKLGSVWIGVYPVEERVKHVRNILNIPDTSTPFSIIALGYYHEEPVATSRLQKSMIHRNGWQQNQY